MHFVRKISGDSGASADLPRSRIHEYSVLRGASASLPRKAGCARLAGFFRTPRQTWGAKCAARIHIAPGNSLGAIVRQAHNATHVAAVGFVPTSLAGDSFMMSFVCTSAGQGIQNDCQIIMLGHQIFTGFPMQFIPCFDTGRTDRE